MYSVHVYLISICTYVHLVIKIRQSRALRLRQDLNPRHTAYCRCLTDRAIEEATCTCTCKLGKLNLECYIRARFLSPNKQGNPQLTTLHVHERCVR